MVLRYRDMANSAERMQESLIHIVTPHPETIDRPIVKNVLNGLRHPLEVARYAVITSNDRRHQKADARREARRKRDEQALQIIQDEIYTIAYFSAPRGEVPIFVTGDEVRKVGQKVIDDRSREIDTESYK